MEHQRLAAAMAAGKSASECGRALAADIDQSIIDSYSTPDGIITMEKQMDNQHKKIAGYRDLNQAEIDLMNEAKELGEKIGKFVEKVGNTATVKESVTDDVRSKTHAIHDPRWLAIAKTDLQKGIMSLIRSIARPTTF